MRGVPALSFQEAASPPASPPLQKGDLPRPPKQHKPGSFRANSANASLKQRISLLLGKESSEDLKIQLLPAGDANPEEPVDEEMPATTEVLPLRRSVVWASMPHDLNELAETQQLQHGQKRLVAPPSCPDRTVNRPGLSTDSVLITHLLHLLDGMFELPARWTAAPRAGGFLEEMQVQGRRHREMEERISCWWELREWQKDRNGRWQQCQDEMMSDFRFAGRIFVCPKSLGKAMGNGKRKSKDTGEGKVNSYEEDDEDDLDVETYQAWFRRCEEEEEAALFSGDSGAGAKGKCKGKGKRKSCAWRRCQEARLLEHGAKGKRKGKDTGEGKGNSYEEDDEDDLDVETYQAWFRRCEEEEEAALFSGDSGAGAKGKCKGKGKRKSCAWRRRQEARLLQHGAKGKRKGKDTGEGKGNSYEEDDEDDLDVETYQAWKKPRSFPEIPELVPRASATAKTRARVMKKMTKPAKPGSAAAKTADGTNTGPRAGAGAKLGAKARARAMEENDEACEAWCLHYEEQEAGWLLHTSCATILTKTRNRVVAYETIVGTGEGKSMIVAALAIYVVVALRKKVHVVVDDETLLERDFAWISEQPDLVLYNPGHLTAGLCRIWMVHGCLDKPFQFQGSVIG
eukprot:s1874_g13.t2